MRERKAIVAIVVWGAVLVSTGAWGCPSPDGQSCTMPDCPMSQERSVDDCHDGLRVAAGQTGDATIPSCEASSPASIGCCDSPTSDDPARLGTTDSRLSHSGCDGALVDRIQPPPPMALSRFAADLLAARDHDVGRYTLLSTFLL